MNQVHKENLEHVENALPNRQGLEVEIFGMEGIPQEVLESHRSRLIQNFYQAQEDRRVATGNPLPGQAKNQRKKIKIETAEELKRRLADWRAKRKAGVPVEAAAPTEVSFLCFEVPVVVVVLTDLKLQNAQYQQQQQQQQHPDHPLQQSPPGQPPYGYAPDSASAGLPQRPGGDDIDSLIRMAEAGVRPPAQAPEGEAAKVGKKDKDKKGRMFYEDAEVSPEERMAALPRYAFAAS